MTQEHLKMQKGPERHLNDTNKIIQPKTEHSRAAATGEDMNCSVLHRVRHIQPNFLPGEEGSNNPTPLIISENNRCAYFQNLTPDLYNVSSAIHNNEKDLGFPLWTPHDGLLFAESHFNLICTPTYVPLFSLLCWYFSGWGSDSCSVEMKILPRSTTEYKWIHQKWRKPKILLEPECSKYKVLIPESAHFAVLCIAFFSCCCFRWPLHCMRYQHQEQTEKLLRKRLLCTSLNLSEVYLIEMPAWTFQVFIQGWNWFWFFNEKFLPSSF